MENMNNIQNLVMEAHDGKIVAQNNQKRGACVKLVFQKYPCPNRNLN